MRINKELIFPIFLALLEFGVFLSNDSYLPALPDMMQDLNLTQALAQSTLSFWFLGSASVQLFVGPLADRFGRRPIVLSGAVLFIVTSLICAYVENLHIFLLARFIQGATVCTTIVGGYAAIHESFSSKRAIQVTAIMGAITILAPALGPLLGAFIVHFTENWRWIFYFLFVWGFGVSLCLYFKMPETLKVPEQLHIVANIKSYKKIITNLIWVKYTLMSCLLIFGFFLWILTSPFLLIIHYNLSDLAFGYAQAIIFSGFILGMQICRRLITKCQVNKIILIFLSLAIISGGLALYLAAFYDYSIWYIIVLISIVAIGASGANTPLSRLAVESSDSPMGQKVGMYSFFFSISGASSAFVSGIINASTVLPILYLGLLGNILAAGLFIIGYKKIKLKEE